MHQNPTKHKVVSSIYTILFISHGKPYCKVNVLFSRRLQIQKWRSEEFKSHSKVTSLLKDRASIQSMVFVILKSRFIQSRQPHTEGVHSRLWLYRLTKTSEEKVAWKSISISPQWFYDNSLYLTIARGFPGGSGGKASACNAGDLGSIPGSGRSPGEGNDNPLQHSCLENLMDGGGW